MTLPGVEQLRPALRAFDFESLFIEGLGWNHYRGQPAPVAADGRGYTLRPLAEKAEFVIYLCSADAGGGVPPYPTRRKIEQQAAKLHFEHLIIFTDEARTMQVWQWVKRETGAPVRCREHSFRAGQSGDPLLQRLQTLAFSLEEEAGLSIPVVAGRVRQALDVERLTKRFYERFRTELSAFQDFIEGIAAQGGRAWYASLMLNRMMFVYFVQKQGFLDGDPDYLRNRLALVRRDNGGGRFHQFYRVFLRRLFHEGLGQPEAERAADLAALLGKVPFLNGGLFEVHDLERDNPEIDIPDEAFARVFEFFDGYRWHLDERPQREDNEINPDVLGYIFEKYVNQKQMGAYYTKEDVTGYLARNTVLPFLFDAARRKCPVAFQPGGGVWRLLQDDPGRYLYSGLAGRTNGGGAGAEQPLEQARKRRCAEVRRRLAAGEVNTVNDLITLNLDVTRFAHDVIVRSEGPELLRAFWQALRGVSVLDPTCGSGAFLFAALTILEPLYSACLEGMRGFLDDLERTERPHHPRALQDFRDVLAQAERHPNVRYFILKSIVLNNLYGVDIMEEAVEICKLRLFLKLVAQLQSYDQIEPLPDIDFNVRAGNTLVGFTSLDAVRRAITTDPDGQVRALYGEDHETLARIGETAEIASRAFDQFRQQQTTLGGAVTAADKAELRGRLDALDAELNRFLAVEYGVKPQNAKAYAAWRESHRPFHWFVEFYAIMSRGGFDVVIGNPPYVARRAVARSYRLKGFSTGACPDIYASVLEQSIHVCRAGGRIGMIVPLSLTFSAGFAPLRTLIYEECGAGWFSSFGRIPSALFSFDTRVRNTIVLGHKQKSKRSGRAPSRFFTTRLHRWFDSERPTLFDRLSYSEYPPTPFAGLIPKLGSAPLLQAFADLLDRGDVSLAEDLAPSRAGNFPLHFKQTAYNWLTLCVEMPPAYGARGPVSQTKYGTVHFLKEEERDLSLILANGLLMFAWWVAIGDDFDVTRGNFASVPLGPRQLSAEDRRSVLALRPDLEQAMTDNLVFKRNAGKNIGNYNLARCRHVTDRADRTWLAALGLEHLWEDLRLETALVVRTSFDGGGGGES